MKTLFKVYNNLNEVNTSTLLMFTTEEYIENFIKEKGLCKCGTKCDCGEKCNCEKCPLQQAIYEMDFKGKKAQTAIIGSKNYKFDRIVFCGLGKESELSKIIVENIGYKTLKFLKINKIKDITCLFNTKIDDEGNLLFPDEIHDTDFDILYSNLVFGFIMGDYQFNKYLTGEKLKAKKNPVEEINFVVKNLKSIEDLMKEKELVRDNVFFCRDLVNEPANVIYPESLVAVCKDFKKLGIKVNVLSEKDMKKLGMGSLLAVGQGSDKEPYMVILEWNGDKDNKDRPLAFVGKGVTFDSGGLSLKPGNSMDTMKCDMSGSATVISLIKLLAMRKAKVNAVAVAALVENMPSGKSDKVGDIVRSMSGQTVEVMNTDAEGRMILADALYYAVTKYNPKLVVDLATLTGAICVALGEKYAGLFTNNDELSKQLERAGEETSERVWRMPLSKLGGFYDKQVDSEIADVRNTGKTRDGGAITAAQFLQRFINNHEKWAHIDIAATAFVTQDGFLTKKDATGYGVRLLNQLIKDNYEK